MNDCHRHRMLRIDTEIDSAPAPAPHCPECEAFAGVVVRIVHAGRELGRAEPPADLVEAGRRRLLDLIASGGGRGLTVLLALAGGVLLAGFALGSGSGRRMTAPQAVVTAAVGTAGAVAAVAGETGGRRHPPRPSGSFVRAVPAVSAMMPARDRAIMATCARSPAFS